MQPLYSGTLNAGQNKKNKDILPICGHILETIQHTHTSVEH